MVFVLETCFNKIQNYQYWLQYRLLHDITYSRFCFKQKHTTDNLWTKKGILFVFYDMKMKKIKSNWKKIKLKENQLFFPDKQNVNGSRRTHNQVNDHHSNVYLFTHYIGMLHWSYELVINTMSRITQRYISLL